MRLGKDRKTLLTILVAAFALRVALLLILSSWDIDDDWKFGWETGRVASSLASGQGFSSPFPEPTGPTAWLMPIYPSLLALIFMIFGIYSTSAALAALLLNSAISVLTTLPLYWVARDVFGHRTALLAAIGLALYPPSIWHSITTIWDTSAVAFALVALMYGLYGLENRWSLRRAALFGAVIGLLVLLNPVILTVLPVLWLTLLNQRERSLGWRVLAAGLASMVALAVVTPWLVRNYHQFDRLFLRSNLGLELKLGNSMQAWEGYVTGASSSAMELGHPTLVPEEFDRFVALGEVAYVEEAFAEARSFIRDNPTKFLRLCGRRVHHFWLGDLGVRNDWTANLHTSLSLSWVKKLSHLAPLPFLILGIVLSLRNRLHVSPLLALFLLFPLVYYLTHVSERYRFPIEPFIVVFACYGLIRLLESVGWIRQENRLGSRGS